MFTYGSTKKPNEKKKSKEDEQTLAELVQLIAFRKQNLCYCKPGCITRIKLFSLAIY